MIFDSGDAAITEDGSVPVQPLVTESVDRDFLELDSLTYLLFNQDSPVISPGLHSEIFNLDKILPLISIILNPTKFQTIRMTTMFYKTRRV
jgi:hypothetical protein